MQTDILVETLDTHTAGEPTRIVTGGVDRTALRGGSVAEKRTRFADTQDWLRRLLVCEPRGHDDMFGAIPVDPLAEGADIGLFFVDNSGYLDMCGHGTIGAVTALIETGQLAPAETITVETPAGVVTTHPTVIDGSVEDVAITNVDSFVYDSITIDIPVDGTNQSVPVDIVFAGNVIALVDAANLELRVDTDNLSQFVEHGLAVRNAIENSYDITHPFTGDSHDVSITEFYEPRDGVDRNIVVFGDGQVDRSPCGTGTCAKMTLLHDRDELSVGDRYEYESVIGTRFSGQLLDALNHDGFVVTTPEVTGSAHITGTHTFLKSENDDIDGFSIT